MSVNIGNSQFFISYDIIDWIKNESYYKNVSGYISYVEDLYLNNDIIIDSLMNRDENSLVRVNISIDKNKQKEFKNKCHLHNLKISDVVEVLLKQYVVNKNVKLNIKNNTKVDKTKAIKKEINKITDKNEEIKDKKNCKKDNEIKKSDLTNRDKKLIINIPDEVLKYQLDNITETRIREEIKKAYPHKTSLIKSIDMEDGLYYLFSNVYIMLFVFKYTTGEIADCFPTRTLRGVQKWLKKLGWELGNFEAQRRIVDRGRRNYKQIHNKSKETRLKNYYSVDGNNPEEYTRLKLNYSLAQHLLDCQVIVGLNNTSILECGKEIDIPIIIFKDNKIYKFAVEYNGDYWHNDIEREKLKKEMVENLNYHLFFIAPKHNATPKQIIENIDNEVVRIKDEIFSIINQS